MIFKIFFLDSRPQNPQDDQEKTTQPLLGSTKGKAKKKKEEKAF